MLYGADEGDKFDRILAQWREQSQTTKIGSRGNFQKNPGADRGSDCVTYEAKTRVPQPPL
jgi:hypothetical protein